MPRLSTTTAVAASALLLAGCWAPPHEPVSCRTTTECPAHAFCREGLCEPAAQPQPAIRMYGAADGVVALQEVTFDGTASVDPNPDQRLTSYRWKVEPAVPAAAGTCDPDPVSGEGLALTTRFPCAGSYRVTLVVRNTAAVEADATLSVAVAHSALSPRFVSQTADLTVGHACSGSPLTCRPTTPTGADLSLAVGAVDDDDGRGVALAYRWEAIAPPGGDPADALFVGGAASKAVTVRIAGREKPIVGDWIFRAHATDSDGHHSSTDVKVTVSGRGPALAAAGVDGPLVAAHRYEGGTYRASVAFAVTATDADGDPLAGVAAQVVEGTRTGCSAEATVAPQAGGGTVTATVSCPDPRQLVAVDRRVDLSVADATGAVARLSLPLTVSDTPPALGSGAVPATIDAQLAHAFGPCSEGGGLCYSAQGDLGAFVRDADGDPATVGSVALASPDAAAHAYDLGGGRFRLEVAASEGINGLSRRRLTARLSDPFGTWAAAPFVVTVADRIPQLVPSAGPLVASVTYDGAAYRATTLASVFSDPDGDPLAYSVSGGSSSAGAAVTFTLPYVTGSGPIPLSSFLGLRLVTVSASDGVAQATSSATVSVQATNAVSVSAGEIVPETGSQLICRCNLTTGFCSYAFLCSNVTLQPTVQTSLPVHVHVASADATIVNGDSYCDGRSCSPPLVLNTCSAVTTASLVVEDGVQAPTTFPFTHQRSNAAVGTYCGQR